MWMFGEWKSSQRTDSISSILVKGASFNFELLFHGSKSINQPTNSPRVASDLNKQSIKPNKRRCNALKEIIHHYPSYGEAAVA
ncbi:hypothetical protein TNCV_4550201 [Trichonephila clavipes]|nr:hypothetical protein TNCV_4550201 [Trichonephila clavipes]